MATKRKPKRADNADREDRLREHRLSVPFPGYYGCAHELRPDDDRREKYAKQRVERGFDDTECWNLDRVIAEFILPRLKRLKEINSGHPSDLTNEKWLSIQDEIIEGLEAKIRDFILKEDAYLKWEKAKKLLFRWIDHFWD